MLKFGLNLAKKQKKQILTFKSYGQISMKQEYRNPCVFDSYKRLNHNILK